MATERTGGAADEGPEQGSGPHDAQNPQEDVKRKFREALERKHGRADRQAEAGERGDNGKIHGAHGPESSQRSFRRKSG
jgi:hypothetical protein